MSFLIYKTYILTTKL